MTDPATVPPVIPEYASAETGRRPANVALYRFAFFLAVLPLGVGILILVLYWLLRSDVLPVLGAFTILGGIVAAGLSALLLGIFAWQTRRDGHATFEAWRGRLLGTTLLLALNVPAAIACLAIGQQLMSTGYVHVQNAGTARIDSFVVSWPGGSRELGPIDAGRSTKQSFVVGSDGGVTFRQTRGAAVTTGTLLGYTTAMQGPEMNVVSSDAAVMVDGRPADPIDPDE